MRQIYAFGNIHYPEKNERRRKNAFRKLYVEITEFNETNGSQIKGQINNSHGNRYPFELYRMGFDTNVHLL